MTNNFQNTPETESLINIMELNAFSSSPQLGLSSEMNLAAKIENVENNFVKTLDM